MNTSGADIISVEQAGTLAGLFRERCKRSPDATAYIQYDDTEADWKTFSWRETADDVSRWQQALLKEGLEAGDRVALMLRNRREWVILDQAALGLGLVTVPIFPNDRADNVAYILNHAEARLLLIEGQDQWQELQTVEDQLAGLTRIVSLYPVDSDPKPLLVHAGDWLPSGSFELITEDSDLDDLATIVYTSGTTGRPKGVMLSHRNILWNARAALDVTAFYPHDLFLSFLPLSHTLERTAGYYLPIMAGSAVAYARSIPQLAEDLLAVKPTILMSVPRIFERVYGKIHAKLEEGPAFARFLFAKAEDIGWRRFLHQQKRGGWSPGFLLWPLLEKLVAHKIKQKLGGRLRFAVCGGAALTNRVAQLFIGLGIPIAQGYGLTETSPIISVNSLEQNIPASVGKPLAGVEVRIGANDELLTRSPSLMLGYWKDSEATAKTIDDEGWLYTGDQVRMEDGHIFITGRLKEVIVLSSGEKVPPGDMEMAIGLDGLFDQILVVGEGRPFLTALAVLDRDRYAKLAAELDLDAADPKTRNAPGLKKVLIERIGGHLHRFPGYARIVDIAVVDEPWSIENGLMTPTMKLRRNRILERHASDVDRLYEGH
jgi:long-chain acyl-CoA synthetase